MIVTYKIIDGLAHVKYANDDDTVAHYINLPIEGLQAAIEAYKPTAQQAINET